jgi:D-lactate dehydrogenase (cytochrome)
LADCIAETVADIAESGLTAPLVGHVGDGNFHLLLLANPDDAGENERARAFSNRLVERALRMEGTCTGEHGVGMGKRKYMAKEHGDVALDAMRAIKRALDPDDILNPGKVLPE